MKKKIFTLCSLFCVGLSSSVSYAAQSIIQGANCEVNLDKTYQTIRGFGGMNCPSWGVDLTESQVKTAFGNGDGQLGFSILRIMVQDQKSNWSREVTTAKRAQALGAITFATPWNPPSDMTETVSRNNRSEKRLKPSSYGAYADHLNAFSKYMKEQGAPLYALSITNEPDYGFDWTWWSNSEILDFTKNYAGRLRENGNKVISAESFAYSKSLYDGILDDANALKNIDIIGTHFYASDANTNVSFFQYAKADQKAPTYERWMTEHYTSSDEGENGQVRADMWPDANDVSYEIYRAMVEGNFSAYVWWYIRRHYGPIKEDGQVSKRGWCMAQYSKFVRPGAVRVDATKNPTFNVYVSVFKSDKQYVIVAVNRSTSAKEFSFSGVSKGDSEWDKYVTSATKNLQKESAVKAEDGIFIANLDPQSTTTYVYTLPQTPQEEVAPYNGEPVSVPGKIEAEEFDFGGEGVSYHDKDSENEGGAFRECGIDIAGGGNSYSIINGSQGEWTAYTVNVEKEGDYVVRAKVATGLDNLKLRVTSTKNDATALLDVPNTESWNTYVYTDNVTIHLLAGEQVVKLEWETGYTNVDYFEISEINPNKVEEPLSDYVDINQPANVYSLGGIFIKKVVPRELPKGVWLIQKEDGSFRTFIR